MSLLCSISVIGCGILQNPSNGYVELSGIEEGSTATYHCNENFELIGNQIRECGSDGMWSGEEPYCGELSVMCTLARTYLACFCSLAPPNFSSKLKIATIMGGAS